MVTILLVMLKVRGTPRSTSIISTTDVHWFHVYGLDGSLISMSVAAVGQLGVAISPLPVQRPCLPAPSMHGFERLLFSADKRQSSLP